MPKLYYTPTSCGAASFMAAYIAGVSIEAEQVNLGDHKTASGADFFAINPKGNVPTLVLDDGTVLNEGAATLQWIADQKPGSVAPVAGSKERYEVIQLLNWTSSEMHASVGPLFNKSLSDEIKDYALKKYLTKLQYANDNIAAGKDYVVGNDFTIADSYFWIVLSWSPYVGVNLDEFPHLKAYYEAHPKIVEAKERMATSPATTC